MKKVISLFLALVLCLSLCACGKNEAEEEKKQEYYGEWIEIVHNTESYTFSAENYGEWELTDEGVVIDGITYIREDCGDFIRLVSEDGKNAYVRSEDLTTTEIEITSDNWQEYFTLEEKTRAVENSFGDLTGYEVNYYFALKDNYVDRLVAGSGNEFVVSVEVSYVQGSKTIEVDDEGNIIAEDEMRYALELTAAINFRQWEFGAHSGLFDVTYGDEHSEYMVASLCTDVIWYDETLGEWVMDAHEDIEIGRVQGTLLLYDLPVQIVTAEDVK